ncbi:MAG: DUF58 domain-containing protein [Acidimicrobiia bacterium]|nr:DUF58 domain-containing protein [Acidimicrobiia bacterium]
MLTRQGWLTGAAAVALVAAGRLFGIFELFVLGAAVAGVLVIAAGSVWATRLQLGVARRLDPPRVHAGSPARVELHVTNESGRRTPVLRLHDPVTGTRGASLLVAPVAPSASVRAAYLLPTERRGVLGVGPLRVTVADPFGLTASSLTTVGRSELVVYPRMDRITSLAPAPGRDSSSATRQPNTLGRTGDDFYALRPYVIGDDLRRVHWPSTARHGELMIRQHELPTHERTTVVLDNRAAAHSAASFELAVSAAASVLNAAVQRADQVRLVTTSGLDSGFEVGRAQLEGCLLHLATAQIEPGASLHRSLELLARKASGGTLVLVAAALAASDLRRLSSLSLRFGRVVTVMFEPSSWDPSGVDQAAPGLSNLVRVTAGTPFAQAWNDRFGPPTASPTAAPLAAAAGAP